MYRTNPARVWMGGEMRMTERTRQPGSGGPAWSGWCVVLLICAALLGWGLIQYATIRDEPRRWDFDVQPDAPGESEASTSRPALGGPAPPQMAPLPEAKTQPAASGDRAGATGGTPVVPAGGRP